MLQVLNGRLLPNLRFGITTNAILGLLATFAQALFIMPVSSAIGQTKWLQALWKHPMDDLRMVDEASRKRTMGQAIVHRKGGYVHLSRESPCICQLENVHSVVLADIKTRTCCMLWCCHYKHGARNQHLFPANPRIPHRVPLHKRCVTANSTIHEWVRRCENWKRRLRIWHRFKITSNAALMSHSSPLPILHVVLVIVHGSHSRH